MLCLRCEFKEDCASLVLMDMFPDRGYVCENPIMSKAWAAEQLRAKKIQEALERSLVDHADAWTKLAGL